jgi:sugar-specific transcriptional regulator TrmB
MNEDVLVDLGLSVNEAKVYLTLLSLGQTTITIIAENCKLHRSNVYDAIKKLIDRGLVGYIKKEDVTFYEANNPQALAGILREKENRLNSIMPQLMLSKKMAVSKGEAHILEGIPAFMEVMYEFLEYKEPILVYGIPKTAPVMLRTKMPHFHKARLSAKVPMKHIYNHNAQERIKFLNEMPHTEARYLPGIFDSEVSTNVCGEQVVLVLWTATPVIIQIKNKMVADSYKRYFSLLWDSAKVV